MYDDQSSTRRLPRPRANAEARIMRSRLVNDVRLNTFNPETATELNRKVVTPPRTGAGMARKTPEILARMPKRTRMAQQRYPAKRLAHLVMLMTPLFCAKMETGGCLMEMDEQKVSGKIQPIRPLHTSLELDHLRSS